MRQPADRSRQSGRAAELAGARTFPATMFFPFVRYAARTGWSERDLTALCAKYGVLWPAINDLTALVSCEGAFKIVEAICTRSGDENLGLHLAREAEPSWMSLTGVLAMAVANVRDAVTVCSDYGHRLYAAPATVVPFIDEEGLLHVRRIRSAQALPLPRAFVEASVGALVVLLRRFTGVQINAIQVTFPHHKPTHTSAHAELFGTSDVRFGLPMVELVFPASVLELCHRSADPALLAFMRRQAEALIERQGGADLLARVRHGLREALGGSDGSSLNSVARSLGMTGRTLQRRLATDGTQFSELLAHVRCERALELLQRPEANLDDIAERIGLADARSLRRALKRRTGRTPSDLRRS